MSRERLIYLPLGGAGEIGMNCYVYGYGEPGRERLIVVDLGLTFPDMDGTPGVDLILPDITWLKERADRIEAIFITHAHEDHVGALPHLWPGLRASVHARAFTANIARRKMEEHGLPADVVQTVSPWPEAVEAGPFRVSFLPVSHSIPESSSMVIDTPAGRVIHTADFKIDLTPVVGEPFDEALWRAAAEPGVIALVCDSTNVLVPHAGRSEASLGPEIEALVAGAEGMVVATTFASNVARLKTLAEAGERAGRSICLLGRAMRRMIEAAVETGVLTGFPKVISPEQVLEMPRENVMLLVTGSQGERRAASAQLARGKYNGIQMAEGDLFLFSSKTIPGNERGVLRVVNQFSELGVEIHDELTDGGHYHVSGHANRPDLMQLHEIVRPGSVIPMHGEHRHLREHAALARSRGMGSAVAPNGTMLALTSEGAQVVDRIEAGRIYLDGAVQIGALDGVVRDRIRMALNGHLSISVLLDEENEPLGEPWCDSMGLPEVGRSGAALLDVIEEDLNQFIGRAGSATLADDDKLDQELRRIARNTALDEIGKKPEVTVVISRLA